NEWRDGVLRDGERDVITVGGKQYRKGLQMACMQCHTSKEKFCDTCHDYTSVKPFCWDCHLTPEEAALKKETH
ncbi:MAG: cytochrome C, partial [Deltaproteobacteria bacterium]|nr:cytochrome C [Deltaproteobacteria bacterium]